MLKKFNRLLAFAAALFMGFGAAAEQPVGQEPQRRTAAPTVGGDQNAIIERAVRRRTLALARQAAAEHARPAREAAKAARAAGKGKAPTSIKAQPGLIAPPGILNPLGTPDYMGGVVPNYANSPLIRKFVDTLPGLVIPSDPTTFGNKNNLGNYIPVALPNTTLFPGSDYYDIDLVDYTQQLHSDLPPTRLRGYLDKNAGADSQPHYLGPVIIAQRDRPVRVKFNNKLGLGAAGNLPIPVDTSLMGAGMAPTGSFTQNRGELHLHGGLNPWISDGTPHQWITPAGDPTPNKKGAAFANVPDMVKNLGDPDPLNNKFVPADGDGIGTYFYTNQQSGRFMFYHDHSFGLTRLNVYMGEAAGYLIVDPVETKLITDGFLPNNGGGVYNYGIPLIFQDKTFVPGPSDLAAQDPTWDTTNWGGYGDLWYPHVYMPNQNPSDSSGANAMGRWDYGPWFWPPVPVADAPNSIPTAHAPVAGANPGDATYPGTPNPSLTPEAFMDTPVVNGTPYPTITVEPKAYRFRMLNAANDRPFGFAFYTAKPGFPTEVSMIDASPAEAAIAAAAPYNLVDGAGVSLWPTDGRAGGVVDFRTIGPDIIQIGNESGFLPAPVRWKSQATTYNYNRRDIVVLDVANHPLFLAPAERADVIVDFSGFAGQTLILYNDMLAPVPAFDVRYDYFTDAPDQTPTGGAPTPLAGYGPNTRTLMQFKVANSAPATAFNFAALEAAFASTSTTNGAFAATQHPPIVPQTFYNSAMNTNYAADTYATIQAYKLPYNKTENGQPVVMPLKPKAIQELFELDYGRMNATLGVELPFTNFNNQTTIPLGYSEPATEVVADGQTQLWKITHNGVDTHPVHFHLFDVQVVNRVGWDGAIRFPEANEIGWKETVRMKPLEDVIIAFRPISPLLPFTLGNSTRVIDPTKPAGSLVRVTDLTNTAVNQVNQGNLGNPINISNNNGGPGYDYGWEYVWHCHILGHEENDFMRPLVLKVANVAPAAPTLLDGTVNGTTRVDLTWTKNLQVNPNPIPADGIQIPVDETGFRIERNPGPAGELAFTKIGTTVPDQTNFTDLTVVSGTSYDYRVIAYNQKGDSAASNTLTKVPGAVAAPVSVSLDALPLATAVKGTLVTFTALGVSAPTGAAFEYQFLVNGAIVQNYSAIAAYSFPLTQAVGTYTVTVNARTSVASPVVTNTLAYTITPGPATGVQLLPNLPSPQASTKTIIFTATGIGSTGYNYQFSVDGTVLQAYSTVNKFTVPAYIAATGGSHAIKVDAVTNLAAVTPEATATVNFTFTAPIPAAPIGISPTGVGIGTTPTYTFNAVFGATDYSLSVWSSATGSMVTRWYTAAEAGVPLGTGIGSIAQTTPLAAGPYVWYVRARNSAGVSPWNTPLPFNVGTVPDVPSQIGPSGLGISVTPSFTFNAVSGAVDYQVSVWSQATGSVLSQWFTAAQVGAPSGTGVGTIAQVTPLAFGPYVWFVHARNAAGSSAWSNGLSFSAGTVPSAPSLISPSGPGISATPTYTFNAVSGAIDYQISLWSQATGSVLSSFYTAQQVGAPTGTGVGSILQSTPLVSGRSYVVYVRARNAAGLGPWSASLAFKVQ